MHDFQHRSRLRPFRELPHAAVDVLEADQGHEEEDAAEDGDPGDGGDKVVEDEILGLEGWGPGAGGELVGERGGESVHCGCKGWRESVEGCEE